MVVLEPYRTNHVKQWSHRLNLNSSLVPQVGAPSSSRPPASAAVAEVFVLDDVTYYIPFRFHGCCLWCCLCQDKIIFNCVRAHCTNIVWPFRACFRGQGRNPRASWQLRVHSVALSSVSSSSCEARKRRAYDRLSDAGFLNRPRLEPGPHSLRKLFLSAVLVVFLCACWTLLLRYPFARPPGQLLTSDAMLLLQPFSSFRSFFCSYHCRGHNANGASTQKRGQVPAAIACENQCLGFLPAFAQVTKPKMLPNVHEKLRRCKNDARCALCNHLLLPHPDCQLFFVCVSSREFAPT